MIELEPYERQRERVTILCGSIIDLHGSVRLQAESRCRHWISMFRSFVNRSASSRSHSSATVSSSVGSFPARTSRMFRLLSSMAASSFNCSAVLFMVTSVEFTTDQHTDGDRGSPSRNENRLTLRQFEGNIGERRRYALQRRRECLA